MRVLIRLTAPFFEPFGKRADALRLKRPRHPDLVEPETDGALLVGSDVKFRQSLAYVLIGLARGHDAETGAIVGDGGDINVVGARKGEGRKAFELLQTFVLDQGRIRPAQLAFAAGASSSSPSPQRTSSKLPKNFDPTGWFSYRAISYLH